MLLRLQNLIDTYLSNSNRGRALVVARTCEPFQSAVQIFSSSQQIDEISHLTITHVLRPSRNPGRQFIA